MRLDNETLKRRLRYQGQQYGNGQAARGGSREPHMLEQAADRIDVLEREALYCKTDYDYLLTITEDKDGLHDWLRTRSSRVGALVGAEPPNSWSHYRVKYSTDWSQGGPIEIPEELR